jgi:hypoxanthine phosphoribosyltransferase
VKKGYASQDDRGIRRAAAVSEIIIPEEELRQRVLEIARGIHRIIAVEPASGRVLGVLFFMSDLLQALTIPAEIDLLRCPAIRRKQARYGAVSKDLKYLSRGRHVLFVEDVIDTGLTLNYILNNLRAPTGQSGSMCFV